MHPLLHPLHSSATSDSSRNDAARPLVHGLRVIERGCKARHEVFTVDEERSLRRYLR